MKFSGERDNILSALVTAARGVGHGGGSLMTPKLYLTAVGNVLTATGSDGDITIAARSDIGGNTDGTAIVPPRLIQDIVKALDGTIGFALSDDGIVITAGRAEFVVRTMVGADLTKLDGLKGPTLSINAALFAEGLRQVAPSALKDDTRAPQLTGVLAVAREDGLRLVATDSYRLAIRDLPGVSALTPDDEGVLIPAKALNELQRLIKDETDTVAFRCDARAAMFETGAVSITTRLLKGPFPDYERLVPDSYPNVFTTDRVELIQAVKRVRTMIRDTKDASTPVRLSFSADASALTVLTPESGHAKDSIDGQFSGTDVTVAFNPSYLIDGLDAVLTDNVLIEVIDEKKPAMIRAATEDGFRYLLMPVRVS